MPKAQHSVQITADNNDVFGGTWFETPPPWARSVRLMFEFSDSDALWDVEIGKQVFAKASGPGSQGADNLGKADWTMPGCHADVNIDSTLEVAVNVVTGGVGMVHGEYLSGRAP